MTLGELATLVALMRRAQKIYFRVRDAESLAEAKRLERQVDAACRRILEDKPTPLLDYLESKGGQP